MEKTMTNPKMSLDGKRVIVIGGTSGIGFATATLAQECGAEIVIASRSSINLENAVTRLGSGATGATLDLADEADIKRFFEAQDPFDHLAITAGDWGGPMFGDTKGLDLTDARGLFDVRFWGALGVAKHAASKMPSGGSITLTSGTLAHRPQRGALMVTVVAGAVEHLARGLAVDFAPLRVNAVCPGLILTEHTKQMPEEMISTYVSGLPIPRAGTPSEAAMAYVYSMMNEYLTGQVLPVDGGGGLA